MSRSAPLGFVPISVVSQSAEERKTLNRILFSPFINIFIINIIYYILNYIEYLQFTGKVYLPYQYNL